MAAKEDRLRRLRAAVAVEHRELANVRVSYREVAEVLADHGWREDLLSAFWRGPQNQLIFIPATPEGDVSGIYLSELCSLIQPVDAAPPL